MHLETDIQEPPTLLFFSHFIPLIISLTESETFSAAFRSEMRAEHRTGRAPTMTGRGDFFKSKNYLLLGYCSGPHLIVYVYLISDSKDMRLCILYICKVLVSKHLMK